MGSRLGVALAAVVILLRAAPSALAATAFDTTVKPVLTRTCYQCHNEFVKNADLDLAGHGTEAAVVANPGTWEKVVEKMRTRVMPPPGFPAVSEAERTAVVEWIETTLARADALAPPNPGRVTARRLNRAEYDNSVRDLLGVDLRPADDFPQDDTGYGFDNNGDVLSLSPALLEKYLLAAERISRVALFGPDPPKPGLVRLTPVRAKIEPSTRSPHGVRRDGPEPSQLAPRHPPVPRRGGLRAPGGGGRRASGRRRSPSRSASSSTTGRSASSPSTRKAWARSASDRQDFTGKTREFRVRVPAGDHRVAATVVRLYEGLPASAEDRTRRGDRRLRRACSSRGRTLTPEKPSRRRARPSRRARRRRRR